MSSYAKLKHAFAIRDELRDLLETQLNTPRKVVRRDNAREATSREIWAEWVLESDEPDYTQAALLIGDFIHNLRAAMDHAIWAITPAEVQLSQPLDVSFPLISQEQKFANWLAPRKQRYGPTVIEILRENQPFNAIGTGRLHPLHILQFLSNTDKHRLLNIVAHNQVNLGAVTVSPTPPGGIRSTMNDGLVRKGSVLARVEFARPADSDGLDLKALFAYEQVFRYVDPDGAEQWLHVGDAMNAIGPAVVKAVGYVISAHARDVEITANT